MRAAALAAIVGASLFVAAPALAGPWNDPAGRVNFTAPNGWQVEPTSTATTTTVLTFDGGHDCFVIGKANSVTQRSSPGAVVRSTSQPMAQNDWVATANSIRDLFPNNSARVTSQTVDTSGFWPVQRAQLQSSRGVVFAAIQSRPGVDLMAFCAALDGAGTSVFDTVFASVSHPNDAAWQAAATPPAAPAVPAATPAPTEPPATPPAQ